MVETSHEYSDGEMSVSKEYHDGSYRIDVCENVIFVWHEGELLGGMAHRELVELVKERNA